MTLTQVKTAQVLLDKCVPNLQSIAYSQEGDKESLSEAQLLERLTGFLVANPKLIEALRARGITVEGTKAAPELEQSTSTEPSNQEQSDER